jgi:hypothetical protein
MTGAADTSDRWYLTGALGVNTTFDEPTDPQSRTWATVGSAVRHDGWETLNLLDSRQAAADRGPNLNWWGLNGSPPAKAVRLAAVGARFSATTEGATVGYLSVYTKPAGSDVAEALRVTGEGNVGIGTTAPVSRLQLRGDLALQSVGSGPARALPAGATMIWNDGSWLRLNQNLDHSKPIQGIHTPGLFAPGSLNVGGARGWVDPGAGNAWITGSVGIGATTLTSKLHVGGNAGLLSLEGTDHAYIQWYPDGLAAGRRAWTGYGSANDNSFFLANEIPGGHIILAPNGGNVGIGTGTPNQRLEVSGGAIIGGIVIGGDAPGVNYNYEYETVGVSNPGYNLRLQSPRSIYLHVGDGQQIETTEHFQSIFKCADFLIGAASRRGSPGRVLVDEGQRLVINYARDWPNVRVEGNFSYGSSRTHKEDIEALTTESALDVIRRLQPVRFSFKNDPVSGRCTGFIAEDVPDAVGSDDRKGVSPMGIIAVLVKTVQEQMKTIASMDAKLDRLARGTSTTPD